MTFGEFLSAEVNKRGMSQQQAAKSAGIPQPTFNAYCCGTRRPQLAELLKLLRAFPSLLVWLVDNANRSSGKRR